MEFDFDTLKCVKMLTGKGFEPKPAEALVETLATLEIKNLYNDRKVNTMVKDAIEECRREFDKQFALMERRVDAQIASDNARITAEITEARAGRRWVIGTIITVGLALAGYLSAVIHFSH